jgi:hypothetical protein
MITVSNDRPEWCQISIADTWGGKNIHVTWSLELEQIIQWAKKKMQDEKQEIAVRENNPALNDA